MRHALVRAATLLLCWASAPGFAATPLVGTSADNFPMNSASKYYAHYANGNYWVAFDHGAIPGCTLYSSPDGMAWTSQGTIFAGINPVSITNEWAVRYLGTTVIASAFNASTRTYRSGTLNSNGTVSWSAESAVGAADATFASMNLLIAAGRPIMWRSDTAAGGGGAIWRGSAIASPTWTKTAANAPAMSTGGVSSGVFSGGALFQTGGASQNDLIVLRATTATPYAAGNHRLVAMKWNSTTDTYDGSWYNVSTLGGGLSEDPTTEVQVSGDAPNQKLFAAVRDTLGNIHAVYVNRNGDMAHYRKAVGFNDSWSRISAGINLPAENVDMLALSAVLGGNLYLFYSKGDDVIYYRGFDGTSWSAESLLVDVSALNLQGALAPMESAVGCSVGLAFIEGPIAPFNIRFTLGVGSCSGLQTTAGSGTYSVTAPGSFELSFNAARGGGVDVFYDLFEDPTRTYDLAGGATDQVLLFEDEIVTSPTYSYSTDPRGQAQLLEATPTRVKVRQDTGYVASGGGARLGGVRGLGDYAVYPAGRMAIAWRRKTTTTRPYTELQLNLTGHYQAGPPYNAWADYSQSGYMGPAQPGDDDFVLLESEVPNARTDFLLIMNTDWAGAHGAEEVFSSYDSGLNMLTEATWQRYTDGTLPVGVGSYSAQTGEAWNFLNYFKPRNLVDNLDVAVTTRSADYRTHPAGEVAINAGRGSQWADATENTLAAADWYNEAEAAYPLELSQTLGLDFTLDGALTKRYAPFFKIRQWRSFVEAPVVTFDADGAGGAAPVSLVKDLTYKASVKPVSRAHFAQNLTWHCTLDDTSITNTCSPSGTDLDVGASGGVAGVDIVPARYGQGANFDANADSISAPASIADFDVGGGAIEFWYQPNTNHDTPTANVFWRANSADDCFLFEKTGTTLRFTIRQGAASNCTSGGTTYQVSVASGAYNWRAKDWVHLRTTWTNASLGRMAIWMNGVELNFATGYNSSSVTSGASIVFGGCVFSCPLGATGNADGILDEISMYSGPSEPTSIAHAGRVGALDEYLADSALNTSLNLARVDTWRRGRYLYFGADSKFLGLNVSLATAGSAVADTDVVWQYWQAGSGAWVTLAPSDATRSFKQTGTVSWADPPGWTPMSVRGGPDLYYVRAHLPLAATAEYGTVPVERQIRTDILLFQYCGDVTTSAIFAFSVPATTEVKLSSFTATPGDGSVRLDWRTASELANLGFHVYRSLGETGPWTRLDSSLIPGLGSSAVGQAYSFQDSGLANGIRYFYRLEDVDASSKVTTHGPVSAVPVAAAAGGEPAAAAGREAAGGAKRRLTGSASCPDWVLAAYGSTAGSNPASVPRCTRHGDPEAVSLAVVSRDSRQATLELRTGGFYALHATAGAGEAGARVRVFVPGFDFDQDPKAPALPFRRALVEAVVGRRVDLGGVRALELQGFSGLVPSAIGKAEMQVSGDGTVRALRREALAPAPRLASPDLARLRPSVFQGEAKSAVVELMPLRYDARRGQLVLAKRLLVKLLFTGREIGESGRGSQGRRLKPEPELASELLGRLHTRGRGLYAVAFEQLFPGRAASIASSQLRLARQGLVQPHHVEPAGDSFGPGSVLYFHADTQAASTDFGAETAWEVQRARDGAPMPLVSAAPSRDAATTAPQALASFEVDRFYQPGLLDAPDPWLWEAVASGATRAKPFVLAGVDAGSSRAAELEVFLQGASESGNAVDHHVSVSVNGTLAGEAQFAGKAPYRVSLFVPASLLREGPNELALTNVADTGVSSLVFLDRFSLAYPSTPSLAGGAFEGTWSETGTAALSGVAAPVALLDVTASAGPSPAGARWLRGYERSGGVLRFRAEAGHRYLVVSQQALAAPRVAAPVASTLRSTANRADYLLIAPRAFLAVAEPLLERRRDQGLAARAVAFEEITDAFGHGQPSAEAIRAFLSFAFQSWARPSPRYVLLLGDSTYDPRNFTGTSQPSPLPALWAKTSYLWTASDPLLAAVNGEDGLPDLAIGRLPAASIEQARALVEKLLAWEDSGQGLAGPAVLVADNPDLAGDFEANAREIAQGYLAGRSELLLLRELGAETRPRVLDALNSGLSYLDYVGHGGAAVWASENVWNSWDAPSLQEQSQQPLLLTLNCLNGYFVAPSFDSLSESLVKAEGRGAIAAFSPSGLSLDAPAHAYHRALMAELTSGRHARLGDAIAAAQQAYAQGGLMPELLTIYHLLGDPGMRIR